MPLLLAFTIGAPEGPGAPNPSPTPVQTAACAGGDTLVGLAKRWAEALSVRDAKLRITIDLKAKLAADGFAQLLSGQADCVLFVREPFPAEDAAFKARFGHPPTLVPIATGSFATKGATHAIAVYVNAANPLAGLTLAQLDAVFSAERRRGGIAVKTWGDLGLEGAWANRPLHRYGMVARRASGNPPGVVNFIQRRVLLDGPFRGDIAEQVDRAGEQALAAIVRRVGEDVDGIGYSGFGYASGSVRAVPLAEHAGASFVAGTPESVADRRYPLGRRIYIMIDRAPGRPLDPALRAFLTEALSPEGQAMLKDDPQGFLPLSDMDAAAARALLN